MDDLGQVFRWSHRSWATLSEHFLDCACVTVIND